MTTPQWAMFGLAAFTFLGVSFIVAPYGRHQRAGWGPSIPARLGWVVMESPSVFALLAFHISGDAPFQPAAIVLLCLWLLHYVHRTFVFPFRIRADGKTMPAVIAAMAIGFNCLNSFVNGRGLAEAGRYPAEWLTDPRFLVGATLFLVGFGINTWADAVLRKLRAPKEQGYSIPRGGLYELISCPNYFGELIEWTGFAIAAWSLPALGFAIYTAANLVPRAKSNHEWYLKTFADYPKARRALLPMVW